MKIIGSFILSVSFALFLGAQSFVPPFELFSKNKVCYLTLADGSQAELYLKSMKKKKGLITELNLVNSSKQKYKYPAAQIKEIYIPASGLQKMMSYDESFSRTLRGSQDVNMDHIKNGYALFLSTEVMLKDGKQTLLLQLLNPGFSSAHQVFHDPLAAETASVAVGGFNVAGGDDKSYYIKTGDKPAYRLMKKNYDEEFKKLYKDCPAVYRKYKNDISWSKFALHLSECDTAKEE